MKLFLIILSCLFLFFVIVFVLFGLLRTIQVQHKPLQKEFLQGKVPRQLPDGFHKGVVYGIKTTWQGKRFDRAHAKGINVFRNGNGKIENYPFKTYVERGMQDKNLKVLKIDYSDNKHPWWIKYILDEIVEVQPGKYLGKVHVTIVPGIPFSLGYFRLEK